METMKPFSSIKIIKEQLRERIHVIISKYRDTISGRVAPDLTYEFYMYHDGADAEYTIECGWRKQHSRDILFAVRRKYNGETVVCNDNANEKEFEEVLDMMPIAYAWLTYRHVVNKAMEPSEVDDSDDD